jgi:aminopeptidase N
VKLAIAEAQEDILRQLYENFNHVGEYGVSTDEIAERRLKNSCLSYLLLLDKPAYFGLCLAQFKAANNMTDQMACLLPIVHFRNNIRDQIVTDFYQQWQDTALVVDKWFSAQGSSYAENSLQSIVSLFAHEAYTLTNPNRARSLLGALIGNSSAFHQADGEGYRFVADRIIELDAINPQVAARMANTFVHWKRLIPAQRDLMKAQIERMLAGDLSNDLSELLTTSLQA